MLSHLHGGRMRFSTKLTLEIHSYHYFFKPALERLDGPFYSLWWHVSLTFVPTAHGMWLWIMFKSNPYQGCHTYKNSATSHHDTVVLCFTGNRVSRFEQDWSQSRKLNLKKHVSVARDLLHTVKCVHYVQTTDWFFAVLRYVAHMNCCIIVFID